MDCKPIYIAAGIFAAASLAPAQLLAFEQQSPAPAVPSLESAPAVKADPNGAQLAPGTGVPVEPPQKKKFSVPGLGSITLPKLNFGLDLMYGNPENDSTNLSITNEPLTGDDDLKVMGKVKKRF